MSGAADDDLWDEVTSIGHSVAIGTTTFSGRSVVVEVSDDDVAALTLTNSDFEDGVRFDHLLDHDGRRHRDLHRRAGDAARG